MNSRVKDALKFAEYRAALNNQIEQIKFKLTNDLTFSTNGGSFAVTTDLIGYLYAQVQQGKETAIVLDKNNTPVKISHLSEFLDKLQQIYNEATEKAYNNYERLRQARKVETVVDYSIEK